MCVCHFVTSGSPDRCPQMRPPDARYGVMRLAIVAHRNSETNEALVDAGESLGIHTIRLTPREALCSLQPGDIALGRLDVRETLDGIEDGLRELDKLAAAGI